LNQCAFLTRNEKIAEIYTKYLHNGGFAVSFFFVLSGFGIVLGYGKSFSENVQLSTVTEFYKRRIIKIYPVYLFTIIWGGIYEINNLVSQEIANFPSIYIVLKKFFLAATMLQTMTVTQSQILNPAAWYISALFVCYLMTPFFISWVNRIKHIRKLVLIEVFLWIILSMKLFLECITTKADNSVMEFLYFTPYSRAFYYAFGICGGMIFSRWRDGHRNVDSRRHFIWNSVIQMVTSSVIIIEYLYTAERSGKFPLASNEMFYGQYNIVVVPTIFMLIITFTKDGILSRVLGSRLFYYFGKLSLYFYLIHYVVIEESFKEYLLETFGTSVQGMTWICLIILVVSLLISIIFERVQTLITSNTKNSTLPRI
jgi:peptidoglycan/LPS O-acetylase OafA/YrhL